jgi:hypothetical protein
MSENIMELVAHTGDPAAPQILEYWIQRHPEILQTEHNVHIVQKGIRELLGGMISVPKLDWLAKELGAIPDGGQLEVYREKIVEVVRKPEPTDAEKIEAKRRQQDLTGVVQRKDRFDRLEDERLAKVAETGGKSTEETLREEGMKVAQAQAKQTVASTIQDYKVYYLNRLQGSKTRTRQAELQAILVKDTKTGAVDWIATQKAVVKKISSYDAQDVSKR